MNSRRAISALPYARTQARCEQHARACARSAALDHAHTLIHAHARTHARAFVPASLQVIFKLHESFDQPNRTCTAPPYEVSEHGWGEFEINIKIYFIDAKEKPISFYHLLKLYPVEGQQGAGATIEKDGALYSEFYDEIVFRNESASMNAALRGMFPGPGFPPMSHTHEFTAHTHTNTRSLAHSLACALTRVLVHTRSHTHTHTHTH